MFKKKSSLILFFILILGLFLRVYKAPELFLYSHDQDLAGWMIKDILVDKHPRLIGQETTTRGVFVGPLFYYLLIPFYLITSMDPIGGLIYSTLIGLFSIFSFYWVFKKIFAERVGLIASFLYAISFYTVFTDREVVPTNSAMLWSVWFFYSLYLLQKGEQKWGFMLSAVLLALTWHINLALVILAPLIFVAFFLSQRKLDLKVASVGILATTIFLFPFVLFETRHNFQQTKAIFFALTPNGVHVEGVGRGLAKLDRVMQLVYRNTTGLFLGQKEFISEPFYFAILLFLFTFLISKNVITRRMALLMGSWILLYIVFFTLNPINISEYYLNGMNVIWVGIASVWLAFLLGSRNYRKHAFLILLLFFAANIQRISALPVNRSGYIEKKQLVEFIKEDAGRYSFPCVAVSYITKPGLDFGYRYFFWRQNLHVNNPVSGSPVYTIVFPHELVGKIDKSFGALGLVLPDYERYNEKDVKLSCSGENSNLTDPMFGYTD